MAISIKYEPRVEEVVRLGYSAIAEACIALSALTWPEPGEGLTEPSEDHKRWREELSDLLPESLMEQLVEFGAGDGDNWTLPSTFFDSASFRPYSLEIARIRALSAGEIQKTVVEEFRSTYEFPFESENRALGAIERNPITWRNLAMDLLENFQPYFEPIWAELEPAFARALARVEQLRKTGPLYQWLPTFDGRISWDSVRSQLLLPGSIEETLDFSPYSEFGVVPTYFGSQQTFFYASCRQRKVGINFYVPDARGAQANSNKASSEGPNVVMDKVELAILEVLNRQPATTAELAPQVKISERTIVNRLKKLEQAGLVQPLGNSNSGRYRKWQANRDRVRETLHTLELRLLGE